MSLPFHNSSIDSERVSVLIRFSNNLYTDLQLPVIKLVDLNISWLRQSVREQNPDLAHRRIRFIHSGRVLNEHTNFITEYHNFVKFNQSSSNEAEQGRFIIHCLIGDIISAEELQQENELDTRNTNQSTTEAPVGFDRLASAGFSPDDITNLRQQFRQIYGDLPINNDSQTNNQDDDDDIDNEQRRNDIRQLEERWIDSTVNEMDEFNQMTQGAGAGGFTTFSNNGNEDLLIGILIGCLFGVLSLFLLKEDGLVNKRQKMAIFAGVIVNFSFGLVRQWS
ncbi:hypothetical protein WICPIJ_009035 [Wickerhamomyces pijperi]|uniref:DSC E3 ubiquitin ligase complex subunit 3 C-terminal domain-containing protein n=1 Tax=Wickerhamomyces pijperi TaxID=599730 RepID=A0A9P8TG54_WICPI|nr:hypothetical protein WICPIJ_009035 [Wickerhamomyces pijperi]